MSNTTFARTKIVATVGPASNTYDKLLALAQAGVNVFRLNFSHGVHAEKLQIIEDIRKINADYDLHLAILGDLQGPKLRIGELENDQLPINTGDQLTFTSVDKVLGTKDKIYISYPNLHKDVKVGEKILIDDGKLQVEVKSIDESTGDVHVEVQYGGLLLPHKGVNLPDTEISLPPITEKDSQDLEFILEQNLDWVALSFVRKAADMLDLRQRVNAKNSAIKTMAKIEMPSAVADIRAIVNASDGIMVARGDMGVELPVEKIPLAQRDIIRKCIHRSKPVIVATQMMESMMNHVKPNRSEITDVANAVLEGTDAVMLSGETAMGQHPVLVVETMRKIIVEVEKTDYPYNREGDVVPLVQSPTILADAISFNACKIANETQASALVGMTMTGRTACRLSSYRPKTNLFVFTSNKALVNQLTLSWGVRAFYYDSVNEPLDDTIKKQIGILKNHGFVEDKDVVVNTGSIPVEKKCQTNMIKISTVSDYE